VNDGTSSGEGRPTLGGRYELGEMLGHGGMAEVRKGHDTRLDRPVAVKMLRTDLARDALFQARFRREAQSAASLNAPTIVAVYDTGEDVLDGARVPYIVMEYVEGQTLRDLLRSGQRLLPSRALEIIDGVLTALDYSHRHGIVHRDVKPANVMLTPSGQVKVMDFGIARAVEDSGATMTQTANVLGTAQYLSPEQARGESVDARSDIYSTGCLLYELLTGRPPFQGESPVAVAYQHVREMPATPSDLVPDIDAGTDAIVMKALAKNPENRYQTAAEMRQDVQRAERGSPVAAPAVLAAPVTQPLSAVSAPADASSGKRRTGAYVGLGLAVVVVLAIFGFAAWALFGGGGDKVRVPDVRGLSLDEATQTLQDKGLVVGQTIPQTNEAEKDTVLAQNPLPQAELEVGGAVDLTVSSGPEQVPVPTLVGLSQSDAISVLSQSGLGLGKLVQRDSDAPAGQVIGVRPPEGTLVDDGSSVDLIVSTGLVPVPGVLGETEAQARADLVNAGFEPGVLYQDDATAKPGTVIAQSPTEGTPTRLGSVVTITVATAPPTPTPTPTPTSATPTVSPSP
jgi:tRNA A-37 threonylcarbamoyl transferase component Bud32